jgi:hypothetical protein
MKKEFLIRLLLAAVIFFFVFQFGVKPMLGDVLTGDAGKTGKLVVTTNEGGREYLNNLIEDKIQLVVMEKYDVMDYTALFMLYSWHNNAIKPGGLDPWVSNWMPNKIDSGLLQITKDNAADVMKAMEEAEKASK